LTPAVHLLDRLGTLGISLRVESGRLNFRAPRGAMTAELIAEIKALERQLVAHLDTSIPRLAERTSYDVSDAQRRLWILHELDPDSAAYHIPIVHDIVGDCDILALQQAFDRLGRRHDALRTAFRLEHDTPRQIVTAATLSLDIVDLSSAATAESDAIALVDALTRRPFDITRAPLARAALIRVAPETNVLAVVLHHLIADGVSVAVLMRELQEYYEAAREERPPAIQPLPIQYRDYAAWQQQRLDTPEGVAHRTYWRQQLASPLPRVDLPTDGPRPAVASADGAEETHRLPREVVDGLRLICRTGGATLFMGIVAAVKALLHRWTGIEDIVVGTPTAGRDHEDAASVAGVFINTLVLRDRVTRGMTFRELIAGVRGTCTAAFDHAAYPFDRLVQDLDVTRDPGRSPVFDVMIILQNQQTDALTLAGSLVSPRYQHTATSKYDLTFNFHEMAGEITIGIEYRTTLFSRARVRRMAAQLDTLLRAAIAEPDRALGELEIVSADERAEIVRAAIGPTQTFSLEQTVVDLFRDRVHAQPAAVAVSSPALTLMYAQLDERSTRVAAALRARGVGPGSLVAVALERSADMLTALLAVWKCGAAYTPVDPAHPADRVRFQLQDSGAPWLLASASLTGRLPVSSIETLTLDTCLAEMNTVVDLASPHSSSLAYVLYTSGSTGVPKGVEVSHRNLTNLLLSMQQSPGLASGDHLLAVTTLSFDIAGLELYLPLIAGARVTIAGEDDVRDGTRLAERLTNSGATVMQATPALWRMLLASGWRGAPQFKALCGGELMPDDLARALAERAGQVWNLYGPTETTIWSFAHRVDTDRSPRPHAGVAIGAPIANTTAWLLDRGGGLMARGCPGDLYLGGEGVARGYRQRSGLTADRFVPDPFGPRGARLYRTGDRAVLLDDGVVQFLGRDDHQVKIRGFRIELGEIEAALARHASVRDSVVSARLDVAAEGTLVAYIVLQDGATFDPTDLRNHVAASVPPQAVPSLFVSIDRLPLTPNGKIDRSSLPAPDRASMGVARLAVPPRDDWERAIAGVWASVLELPEIGVHDNFFELGGHSLRATRAAYLLQSSLAVDVRLVDLFKSPTVAELAERLRPRCGADADAIRPMAAPTHANVDAPLTPEEAQLLGDI
jgi:amino acid adenylation domain-containing protein